MKTTTAFHTAALAFLLTSTPALAQMHDMGSMTHPTTNTTMSGITYATDTTGLAKLSGEASDRALLSMMIAHHQGALDMSGAVIKNAHDPQVKACTNAILKVQQQETGQMNSWLKTLGVVDKTAQATMMKDILADLRKAGSNQGFVQGMLLHHEPEQAIEGLYLVAPDSREGEMHEQLNGSAFVLVEDLGVRYLPYGELEKHREAMARFGTGFKAVEVIARTLL